MVNCTTNNANHNKITLQSMMDTWTGCQKSQITTELRPNHYPPKYYHLRELIDQLKGSYPFTLLQPILIKTY